MQGASASRRSGPRSARSRGVEADGVALGVDHDGERAVLTDFGLRDGDLAAGAHDAGNAPVEVAAGVEIDERALPPGLALSVIDEGAGDGLVVAAREDGVRD